MARTIQQYMLARDAANEALSEALTRIFFPPVINPATAKPMLRYGASDIELGNPGFYHVWGWLDHRGCEYTDGEQVPIDALNEALEAGNSRPIQKWYTAKCLQEVADKAMADARAAAEARTKRREMYESLRKEFGEVS